MDDDMIHSLTLTGLTPIQMEILGMMAEAWDVDTYEDAEKVTSARVEDPEHIRYAIRTDSVGSDLQHRVLNEWTDGFILVLDPERDVYVEWPPKSWEIVD